MPSTDIVILYEHVVRELDVACALKHYLRRDYGLNAELVQYPYGVAAALDKFDPEIVVLPFCYSDCYAVLKHDFAACLSQWPRAHYVNLAWEQLLYEGNRAAKTPGGEFATQHVLHHAWSDFFARYLVEQGLASDHVFVNGHPAYALYDAPYRSFFKTRDELAQQYKLDPIKQWVFFPENYNWMFYRPAELRRLSGLGTGDKDQKAEAMSELQEFCEISFREVMRWCADAARRGGYEFIVRPRPATPVEQFAAAAGDVLGDIPDRLHFLKEGTVREWILASDIVISSHSTSLIEAAVAGKAAFMLAPFPMPSSLRVGWQECTAHLHTQAEFELALEDKRSADASLPLGTWARAHLMSHGDSIWNLASFLGRLSQGDLKPLPSPTRRSLMPPGTPLPWLSFEVHRHRSHNRWRQASGKPHPKYQRDVLPITEVNKRVERWRQVLGEHRPLAAGSNGH